MHMGFLNLKIHQNPFSAGAPTRTPLGSLRCSPDPLVGLGSGTLPLIPSPSTPSAPRFSARGSLRLIPTLQLLQYLAHSTVNLQHSIIDLPASPTYCCYTTFEKIFFQQDSVSAYHAAHQTIEPLQRVATMFIPPDIRTALILIESNRA